MANNVDHHANDDANHHHAHYIEINKLEIHGFTREDLNIIINRAKMGEEFLTLEEYFAIAYNAEGLNLILVDEHLARLEVLLAWKVEAKRKKFYLLDGLEYVKTKISGDRKNFSVFGEQISWKSSYTPLLVDHNFFTERRIFHVGNLDLWIVHYVNKPTCFAPPELLSVSYLTQKLERIEWFVNSNVDAVASFLNEKQDRSAEPLGADLPTAAENVDARDNVDPYLGVEQEDVEDMGREDWFLFQNLDGPIDNEDPAADNVDHADPGVVQEPSHWVDELVLRLHLPIEDLLAEQANLPPAAENVDAHDNVDPYLGVEQEDDEDWLVFQDPDGPIDDEDPAADNVDHANLPNEDQNVDAAGADNPHADVNDAEPEVENFEIHRRTYGELVGLVNKAKLGDGFLTPEDYYSIAHNVGILGLLLHDQNVARSSVLCAWEPQANGRFSILDGIQYVPAKTKVSGEKVNKKFSVFGGNIVSCRSRYTPLDVYQDFFMERRVYTVENLPVKLVHYVNRPSSEAPQELFSHSFVVDKLEKTEVSVTSKLKTLMDILKVPQ